MPKIDGIYIGKNRVKVNEEEIDEEKSKSKDLEKTVVNKFDSEKGDQQNLRILIPCIKEDLAGEWIHNEIEKMVDQVSSQSIKELKEMIKEVTYSLYGCEDIFTQVNGEAKRWNTLNRRLQQVSILNKESEEKEIQFGLGTKVKETELEQNKRDWGNLRGVKVEFSELKNIGEEHKTEIKNKLKEILIKALSKVLREGKWSPGIITRELKQQQYNSQSRRYSKEESYSDEQIRQLIDKCGANCMFSTGQGIVWNPNVRQDGAAKWFEDKMRNTDTNQQKMGLKDAMLSMNFNWRWLREIIEVAIWKEVHSLIGENKQNIGQEMCRFGDWGVACPKGGVVWGRN
ncbi:hypothetical protein MSUIS_07520 [Mycoplasma suis KI3806]|uniref:Uncharacterized protein n=1 Tax=Mycoplasma suis (strain KI_3806) TaxID=708248 RepID=F0V2G4_MYCS3|nr:hypothetical protein MSUIS_07520 [Mycoplasma suis KI3806]